MLDDPENLKIQLSKWLEKTHSLPNNITADKNDRELEKLTFQENRLIDAYREGIITLAELKDQKAKLATKRKILDANKKAALGQQEDPGQPEITTSKLRKDDVSAHYHRVMAKTDFDTRRKLVNLLLNSVTLYPDRAVVEGNIPIL